VGSARLCPYCNSCDETQQHFLNCTNERLQESWKRASDTVIRKLKVYDSNINHQLLRLIGLAITTWRTTKSPKRPTFLGKQFYSLFDKQAQVGWDQILMGRFSKSWTTVPTTSLDCRWLSYTIRTIWNQLYEVWTARCKTAHGEDTHSKRKRALLRLTPQVEQLYKEKEHISSDYKYIFKNKIEDTLNLPTPAIENWLFKARLRIQSCKKRTAKHKKSNGPLHPFFTSNLSKKGQSQLRNRKTQLKKKEYHQKGKITTSITKYFAVLRQRKTSSPKNDLLPP
jgi:hypothetical protein